jgi:RNA polymerase sigma factor (sigma-70 family)
MSTLTIEDLVVEYQRTLDELVFREIHKKVSANWPTLIQKLAKRYYLDEDDVSSVAHFKLYELAKTFDRSKGYFINMLGQAIRRGCIDLVRQKKRKDTNEVLFEDSSTIENQSEQCANAEMDCIEYLQKKYDQRQLVEQLIAKADDKTRQCIIALVKEDFSYKRAAKRVGTDRKNLRRRIQQLARHFNGNYYDYFTVLTTSKSISA